MPPNPPTDRALRWRSCINARDLGGYATMDGATTRRGAVVRADSPSRLTAEGRAALDAYGIHTAIDLRIAVELRDDPSPLAAHPAITAHHLPLNPNDRAVVRAVRPHTDAGLPYMAAVNAAYLAVNREQIAAIMRAVADAPEGGVLIHCSAGRDRTGLIAALLLAAADVPADAIVADYARSFTAIPAAMEATLVHLDQEYGGVPAYLRDVGLSHDTITRLRRLRGEGVESVTNSRQYNGNETTETRE